MRIQKKLTALAMLCIHAVAVFYPGASYALTSGPSQPEASQFQPASISNLVDPFSGDFNYNIPLLDVDGYPVNLAYKGGGSMDEEASWVGYGWNVNMGSIDRTMKGIPDDFNGTDKITKEYNMRPDITGGVSFNASTEIFGLDFLGANASVDLFYNNQRGIGVEIGAGISASLNTAKHVAGEYTAGLSAGGNLGISSNSQTGADFNFGANIGVEMKDKENKAGALGLSFGGSLNSRAGLKSTTLGTSFNTSKKEATKADILKWAQNSDFINMNFAPMSLSGSSGGARYAGSFSTTYGQAFNPTITMPMKNESVSLSPQMGVELWGLQIPLQLTGHYTKQSLQTNQKQFPAYGFLHAAKGRNDVNALLDFNREKDVPYMESTPTLAVPYVTQDMFMATSQFGSSQFKAVTNSSGVFFDSYGSNVSSSFSLGVEFGAGGGIKGGADLSGSGSSTVTRKWNNNNDFLQHGDFSAATGADGEDAYFKLVGEKTSANKDYLSKIAGTDPVKIQTDDVNDDAKAFSLLASNNKNYPVTSKLARNIREPRGEMMVPMTAATAGKFALDKFIKDYDEAAPGSPVSCNNGVFGTFQPLSRVSATHKAHHLSEINVVKSDGMRLVYGVPVYNNEQVDVTFNTAGSPNADNLVQYSSTENSTGNRSGVDFYFSKETVPAYATSFLLSGVCSPDYSDLTGNGISDDDLGTAVKFNYSLVNPAYKWRTPNGRNGASNYANFSEGNKSQADDNKASFSYGSKELWYAQSVESKNMVAVFRLGDRNDGYGYMPNGSLDQSSKQKRLERIDLYTKAELIANPADPTPIKSVHFEYDYSLFGNVPNNLSGGGKLTLKSVYFTYGKSNLGNENRYYFTYAPGGNFEYQQYDRWGTYKDKALNNSKAGVDLGNNDFPYTIQDKASADAAVQKWQLSEIELPSGGKIKVDYESDDYAFVQNQRAMQMAKIVGYGALNKFDAYQETDKIYIQLPAASTNANVGWEYFEGVDQLYYKTMANLDNNGANELVGGYAKVKKVEVDLADSRPDVAIVTVETRGGYHPVAAAAWQHMRTNLPKLAYPYSVNDDLGPLAFIKALIAAIKNVGELLTPFETKAMRQNFAKNIVPGKGFARIVNKYNKLGGGLRVKKIVMNDIWADMAGAGNGKSALTGMVFDYTKKYKAPDGTELTISSGVAAYEPMAGSEENPFKQPISYQQKQHLTTSIYTVEEPLGESYFPAPSVGYSQVTIRNLDAEGNVVNNGYVLKKFYTAKDFPTIVKRTDLSKNKYNQTSIFGLFDIDNGNSVVLSQGFYVENNDMHGKPLSEENFDGSGKMLSGSYYHYKSSGTEQLTLDNNTLVLKQDGTVQNELVGEEFEMYHDMREQVTDNIGVNLNLNLDVLFLAFITIPIPTFIPIVQSTYCGYQSASTIKVVNRYAIADKVTTIENGSTMVSENVLWDDLTGQVLLTKTQNGFDDPVYNFNLPAYMVSDYEKGMGAAYKNTGIVFKAVAVTAGQVPSGVAGYIVAGDELGVEASGETVWAMQVPGAGLRLIKKDGSMFSGTGNLVLLRSGRRNLMASSTYSVVSLKNPIRNGKIEIDHTTEVLSTSASTFSDEWSAETKNITCINTEGPMAGKAAYTVNTQKKAAANVKPVISAATKAKLAAQLEVYKKNNFKDALVIGKQSARIVRNGATTLDGASGDCPDASQFSVVQTTCDGNSPALQVTYTGAPGSFPADKAVVLQFTILFGGGYMESQTVTITACNLSDVACFPGNSGLTISGIYMTGSTCQEFSCGGGGADFCVDTSLYRIEHDGTFDGTCVRVTYIGTAPFPPGTNVYFEFVNTCFGTPRTGTITINSQQLTGQVCGLEGRGCQPVSEARLNRMYCSTNNCDVCNNPRAYSINVAYGDDKTGKVKVDVAYNCAEPFPPGVTVTLTFAYVCPGTNYIERKSIQISASNLSGTLYFVTPSSPPGNTCATSLDNLLFEGVTCGAGGGCCPPPVNRKINPYYTGLMGNWRSKESFAYTTERNPRIDPINQAKQPTNLRKGGIFKNFTSFYKVENGKFVPRYSTDNNWVAAATVTKVNTKGQEVENKDALDKYSAAQFGFNELLATAVSSNARNYEMAYDGFEDYVYNTNCGSNSGDTCSEDGHFNFKRALRVAGGGISLVNTEAHTGNYALRVTKGTVTAFTNRQISYSLDDQPKYDFNSSNEMMLRAGGVIDPFRPLVGKKYVLSGWIKGDVAAASDPGDNSKAKIVCTVNGQPYSAIAAKAGPKVEGWTRVMTVVEMPASLSSIPGLSVRITLLPGAADAYFDDIRIHPYDGNMKSFAYDYRTTRLMAELDENNYATFFEYDDEGKLLRNKKETEKGIVTLKETRSRVRKNLH